MAKNRAFGVAVIAGLVGAVAGLLFAPKSGKETRDDIKATAEDVKQRASTKTDDLKKVAEKGAREAKGTWDRTAKGMSELASDAKTRAGRVASDAKSSVDSTVSTAETKKKLGDNRKEN